PNPPEKIVTLTVDPASSISDFHGRVIASALKLQGPLAKQCADLVRSLYTLFVEKDASLIEINPLIVTKDGNLLCLDAKIGFDDNALFRHKDIASLRDIHEEDPAEVEASDLGLSYVKLDGSIGCLVNGAGLAMSTMDLIKLYCGRPRHCRTWTSSSSMAASPPTSSTSAAARARSGWPRRSRSSCRTRM